MGALEHASTTRARNRLAVDGEHGCCSVAMQIPPPTPYAKRGGASIAFQAFGEGPGVVMLPAAPMMPSAVSREVECLRGHPAGAFAERLCREECVRAASPKA